MFRDFGRYGKRIMSYKVKLEIFEGPFDLLVYLVESSEMSIYDIKISEITDKYLEYISEYESRDIEVSAEFLVLAATLIEIKSKMLLPGVKKDEEDKEIEDPRKDLVDRLIEYKKFKEAAELLEKREEKAVLRTYKPMEDLGVYDNRGAFDIFVLDPGKFISVFRDFLERRQKLEEIQSRYGDSVRREKKTAVRDRMRVIRKLIAAGSIVSFSEAVEDCSDNFDVAVTFVALLEMMRNGTVSVSQKKNFAEIFIEGRKSDGEKSN